jgi:hypothetical protein
MSPIERKVSLVCGSDEGSGWIVATGERRPHRTASAVAILVLLGLVSATTALAQDEGVVEPSPTPGGAVTSPPVEEEQEEPTAEEPAERPFVRPAPTPTAGLMPVAGAGFNRSVL